MTTPPPPPSTSTSARELFFLVPDASRFTHQTRATWHLRHLNRPVPTSPTSPLTLLHASTRTSSSSSSPPTLIPKTSVYFFFTSYRVSLTLDLSSSSRTFCPTTGSVLLDSLRQSLKLALVALLQRVTTPAPSSTTYSPTIHLTISAYLSPTHPLATLVHNFLLTPTTISALLSIVETRLAFVDSTSPPPSVDEDPLTGTPLSPMSAIMQNSLFILDRLPRSACPLAILITDGVLSLPHDSGKYLDLASRFNRTDVSLHIVQVGSSDFHADASFGLLPNTSALQFLASHTGGSFYDELTLQQLVDANDLLVIAEPRRRLNIIKDRAASELIFVDPPMLLPSENARRDRTHATAAPSPTSPIHERFSSNSFQIDLLMRASPLTPRRSSHPRCGSQLSAHPGGPGGAHADRLLAESTLKRRRQQQQPQKQSMRLPYVVVDYEFPWVGPAPPLLLYRERIKSYQLPVDPYVLLQSRVNEGFRDAVFSRVERQAVTYLKIVLILEWCPDVRIEYSMSVPTVRVQHKRGFAFAKGAQVTAQIHICAPLPWVRGIERSRSRSTSSAPSPPSTTALVAFVTSISETDLFLRHLCTRKVPDAVYASAPNHKPTAAELGSIAKPKLDVWALLAGMSPGAWSRWMFVDKLEVLLCMGTGANSVSPFRTSGAVAVDPSPASSSSSSTSDVSPTKRVGGRYLALTLDSWATIKVKQHTWIRFLPSSTDVLDADPATVKSQSEAFCIVHLTVETIAVATVHVGFFDCAVPMVTLMLDSLTDAIKNTTVNVVISKGTLSSRISSRASSRRVSPSASPLGSPRHSPFSLGSRSRSRASITGSRKMRPFAVLPRSCSIVTARLRPSRSPFDIMEFDSHLQAIASLASVHYGRDCIRDAKALTTSLLDSTIQPTATTTASSTANTPAATPNTHSTTSARYATKFDGLARPSGASAEEQSHTLSGFVRRRRWLWRVDSSSAANTCFSRIRRARFDEGFLLVASENRTFTLTRILEMQQPPFVHPCLVQYGLSQPHPNTIQIDLWMEPTAGTCAPLTSPPDSLPSTLASVSPELGGQHTFNDLADWIELSDSHIICALATFDRLRDHHAQVHHHLSVPASLRAQPRSSTHAAGRRRQLTFDNPAPTRYDADVVQSLHDQGPPLATFDIPRPLLGVAVPLPLSVALSFAVKLRDEEALRPVVQQLAEGGVWSPLELRTQPGLDLLREMEPLLSPIHHEFVKKPEFDPYSLLHYSRSTLAHLLVPQIPFVEQRHQLLLKHSKLRAYDMLLISVRRLADIEIIPDRCFCIIQSDRYVVMIALPSRELVEHSCEHDPEHEYDADPPSSDPTTLDDLFRIHLAEPSDVQAGPRRTIPVLLFHCSRPEIVSPMQSRATKGHSSFLPNKVPEHVMTRLQSDNSPVALLRQPPLPESFTTNDRRMHKSTHPEDSDSSVSSISSHSRHVSVRKRSMSGRTCVEDVEQPLGAGEVPVFAGFRSLVTTMPTFARDVYLNLLQAYQRNYVQCVYMNLREDIPVLPSELQACIESCVEYHGHVDMTLLQEQGGADTVSSTPMLPLGRLTLEAQRIVNKHFTRIPSGDLFYFSDGARSMITPTSAVNSPNTPNRSLMPPDRLKREPTVSELMHGAHRHRSAHRDAVDADAQGTDDEADDASDGYRVGLNDREDSDMGGPMSQFGFPFFLRIEAIVEDDVPDQPLPSPDSPRTSLELMRRTSRSSSMSSLGDDDAEPDASEPDATTAAAAVSRASRLVKQGLPVDRVLLERGLSQAPRVWTVTKATSLARLRQIARGPLELPPPLSTSPEEDSDAEVAEDEDAVHSDPEELVKLPGPGQRAPKTMLRIVCLTLPPYREPPPQRLFSHEEEDAQISDYFERNLKNLRQTQQRGAMVRYKRQRQDRVALELRNQPNRSVSHVPSAALQSCPSLTRAQLTRQLQLPSKLRQRMNLLQHELEALVSDEVLLKLRVGQLQDVNSRLISAVEHHMNRLKRWQEVTSEPDDDPSSLTTRSSARGRGRSATPTVSDSSSITEFDCSVRFVNSLQDRARDLFLSTLTKSTFLALGYADLSDAQFLGDESDSTARSDVDENEAADATPSLKRVFFLIDAKPRNLDRVAQCRDPPVGVQVQEEQARAGASRHPTQQAAPSPPRHAKRRHGRAARLQLQRERPYRKFIIRPAPGPTSAAQTSALTGTSELSEDLTDATDATDLTEVTDDTTTAEVSEMSSASFHRRRRRRSSGSSRALKLRNAHSVSQRRRVPFWLTLYVNAECSAVHVRFHTSQLAASEVQRVCRLVSEGISRTCVMVNQQCLLQSLNETRACHPLLIEPGASDPLSGEATFDGDLDAEWRDRARKGRSDESAFADEDAAEELLDVIDAEHFSELTRRANRAHAPTGPLDKDGAIQFAPGAMACPCIKTVELPLHPRVPASSARAHLRVQALDPFAVNNRKDLYVFQSQNGAVCYLRFVDNEERRSRLHLSKPQPHPSARLVDDVPTDAASVSGLSSPAPSVSSAQSEPVANSKRRVEAGNNAESDAPHRSGQPAAEAQLFMEVFGVERPGNDLKHLTDMLGHKLLDAAMHMLSRVLRQYAETKLKSTDFHFLRPATEPSHTMVITLPRSVEDPYRFMLYLRTNLTHVGFLKKLHRVPASADDHNGKEVVVSHEDAPPPPPEAGDVPVASTYFPPEWPVIPYDTNDFTFFFNNDSTKGGFAECGTGLASVFCALITPDGAGPVSRVATEVFKPGSPFSTTRALAAAQQEAKPRVRPSLTATVASNLVYREVQSVPGGRTVCHPPGSPPPDMPYDALVDPSTLALGHPPLGLEPALSRSAHKSHRERVRTASERLAADDDEGDADADVDEDEDDDDEQFEGGGEVSLMPKARRHKQDGRGWSVLVEVWAMGKVKLDKLIERMRLSFHQTVHEYRLETLAHYASLDADVLGDSAAGVSPPALKHLDAKVLKPTLSVLSKAVAYDNPTPAVQRMIAREPIPNWCAATVATDLARVASLIGSKKQPLMFTAKGWSLDNLTPAKARKHEPDEDDAVGKAPLPAAATEPVTAYEYADYQDTKQLEDRLATRESRLPAIFAVAGIAFDAERVLTPVREAGGSVPERLENAAQALSPIYAGPSAMYRDIKLSVCAPFPWPTEEEEEEEEAEATEASEDVDVTLLRNTLFFLEIVNRRLVVWTYNWRLTHVGDLISRLNTALSWIKKREHLLSNVLHQKLGLFHHFGHMAPASVAIVRSKFQGCDEDPEDSAPQEMVVPESGRRSNRQQSSRSSSRSGAQESRLRQSRRSSRARESSRAEPKPEERPVRPNMAMGRADPRLSPARNLAAFRRARNRMMGREVDMLRGRGGARSGGLPPPNLSSEALRAGPRLGRGKNAPSAVEKPEPKAEAVEIGGRGRVTDNAMYSLEGVEQLVDRRTASASDTSEEEPGLYGVDGLPELARSAPGVLNRPFRRTLQGMYLETPQRWLPAFGHAGSTLADPVQYHLVQLRRLVERAVGRHSKAAAGDEVIRKWAQLTSTASPTSQSIEFVKQVVGLSRTVQVARAPLLLSAPHWQSKRARSRSRAPVQPVLLGEFARRYLSFLQNSLDVHVVPIRDDDENHDSVSAPKFLFKRTGESVLLMQLDFCDGFVRTNFFVTSTQTIAESWGVERANNLSIPVLRAVSLAAGQLHATSFVYDFHLRYFASVLAESSQAFGPKQRELLTLLDWFCTFYPYPPDRASDCLVYEDAAVPLRMDVHSQFASYRGSHADKLRRDVFEHLATHCEAFQLRTLEDRSCLWTELDVPLRRDRKCVLIAVASSSLDARAVPPFQRDGFEVPGDPAAMLPVRFIVMEVSAEHDNLVPASLGREQHKRPSKLRAVRSSRVHRYVSEKLMPQAKALVGDALDRDLVRFQRDAVWAHIATSTVFQSGGGRQVRVELNMTPHDYEIFETLSFRRPLVMQDPSLSVLTRLPYVYAGQASGSGQEWLALFAFLSKVFHQRTRFFCLEQCHHFFVLHPVNTDFLIQVAVDLSSKDSRAMHFFACRREFDQIECPEEADLIDRFVNAVTFYVWDTLLS